ncbi:MAG TPA: alpha/beta hydrolase [Flavisolibacter sp.]
MRFSQRVALRYIRTKFRILSAVSKKRAARKAFELFCTPQYRNKKKLPRIFEQAEKITFPFHKSTIKGYRWNPTGKEKLLILHGFESSVINFDRYVKPLVSLGYCVLAFDAPAHGRSTGKMINILMYRELINLVNERYGPISSFLAHSMGGLALSVTIEEWPCNEDLKVVLIAPATETTSAADSLFQLLKLDEGVRREFDSLIEREGKAPISWFSVARAAENIRSRVMWFHDRDDNMTPLSDVERVITKNYPNFQFHITDGLGHRRIYRDNKVTKAVFAFFEKA